MAIVASGSPAAPRQNELIDRLNALSSSGAADEAQYGTAGITFQGPPPTHFGDLRADRGHDLSRTSTGPRPIISTREPDPLRQGEDDLVQSASGRATWTPTAIRSAATAGRIIPRQVVVWHPGDAPTTPAMPTARPAFAAGHTVYCHWNPQSGRWEIECPGPEHLAGRVATAYVVPVHARSCPLERRGLGLDHLRLYCPDTALRAGVGRGGGLDGRPAVAARRAYAIWSPPGERGTSLTDQFKLSPRASAYDDCRRRSGG